MFTFDYPKHVEADVDFQKLLTKTKAYTKILREVVSTDDTASESSINVPDDTAMLKQVEELASQKAGDGLRYHIVVGIGGSNLGAKAVYDALGGARDNLRPERYPKLIFAETTSPEWLRDARAFLDGIEEPGHVLVSVISKSGGTTETLANFEVIMDTLRAKFGDEAFARVVAITDEDSKLWQAAGTRNMARLAIPKSVGGRYSVLTSVGLFPLATVGIDIDALLAGAQQFRDAALQNEHNDAAVSASVLAHYYHADKSINDNFFFSPELESLGKWYRQLMGESIGKAQTRDGTEAHVGITPTVSLGSTDLHSVGQLYLGGPNDKVTTFVYNQTSPDVPIPEERVLPELVPMIDGKSAGDIMNAILEGTKTAYQKAGLVFMEIALERIDEESLGAYLQFKMMEMMYLGYLLDVNPFDQPSVEDYKVETKRILEG